MTMTKNQHRVRSTGRTATAVAGIAMVLVMLTGCLSPDQTADLDLINKARTANRKGTLTSDQTAAAKAQAWSERMAKTGVLEHTGGGAKMDPTGLKGWCSLGENVGKGGSVQAVHDAFLASSAHKANMLGAFKTVGTGVFKSGRTYWVTEIYIKPC